NQPPMGKGDGQLHFPGHEKSFKKRSAPEGNFDHGRGPTIFGRLPFGGTIGKVPKPCCQNSRHLLWGRPRGTHALRCHASQGTHGPGPTSWGKGCHRKI